MSRNKKSTFLQTPPHLGNQFLEDTTLQEILNQKIFSRPDLDPRTKSMIRSDLEAFGGKVMGDIWQWAIEAEEHIPTIRHFDGWQRRIDRIETSEAWKQLVNTVSPQEGIVAWGYDPVLRKENIARLYQFAKLYLYNPSSAVATCPLAMTDGAARLIEEIGTPFLKSQVLPHLLSRDPETFWTSGQWMTEKPGGSDVSNSETVARHVRDDEYLLDGFKWFTSATDCQVTFGLARIVDGEKRDSALSLFFIRLRDEEGNLNGIKIHKLKDKLGTKALPTAELSLRNTRAQLIGKRGRGVASISYMLNITRTYNSICAVSYMRRAVALARDYASRRSAFNATLDKQPLHVHTIASMEAEASASLIAVMYTVELLNKEESRTAHEEEQAILRLMIPVYKMYTGKKTVTLTSEGIECIGGVGYLEDTHIPVMLRNAQVLPIWEGTSNVMSLDVQRVLHRHPKALAHVGNHISRILSHVASTPLVSHKESLQRASLAIGDSWKQLTRYVQTLHSNTQDPRLFQVEGRELAFSIAHCFTAARLLDHYLVNKRVGASDRTLNRNIAVIDQYIEDHTPLCVLKTDGGQITLKRVLDRDDLLGNDRAAFDRTPEHLRSRY